MDLGLCFKVVSSEKKGSKSRQMQIGEGSEIEAVGTTSVRERNFKKIFKEVVSHRLLVENK